MQAGCSERLILQDFKACTQHLRKGILVQPSVTNIFQWEVILMPSSGFFKDQILTCLVIFDNFPAQVPRVVFQSGILHPLIYPQNHVFDTSEMFKEWNVTNRVYTLLNYIYDSFLDISVPGGKEVPNQEAAALLRKGNEYFMRKAMESLPEPPHPTERSELNIPPRWNQQKERVARILATIK